ncbi:MAG: M42 family metallopeptidase [Firmicutes bacterium]|nr:M42 family metallopeptidase [Bacillota bacterium]
MDTLKILKDMTQINSASGNETAIREYIKTEAEKYCDEVYVDAMGNLTAHKKGGGKKIMFAAHMDEIGIIVTDTDDKGFIRFSAVGGLNIPNLVNLRVRFSNGIEGVIGAEEDKFKGKPALSNLYIDIGAADKKAAQKQISVGDTAVFVGGFVKRGDNIISKALDNRAGCAVILKALSEIKESPNDLYFVFTVQEEVGFRGARTAAFDIEPEIAVAVDVTDTGDTPSAPTMAVEMGKGAAVKVMDRSIMCDSLVRSVMIETAKREGIPYQLEIMTDGGTDAGAIHLTRAGVKTGGISIPTRYIHSPSEMANINDIENCVALVRGLASQQW